MAQNENIKEFTQDTVETTDEAMEVAIQKKGLFERFMALKTWQKIAVITILTGAVAGGTFLIIKLINNKPEAVADAIEQVAGEAVVDTVAQAI